MQKYSKGLGTNGNKSMVTWLGMERRMNDLYSFVKGKLTMNPSSAHGSITISPIFLTFFSFSFFNLFLFPIYPLFRLKEVNKNLELAILFQPLQPFFQDSSNT